MKQDFRSNAAQVKAQMENNITKALVSIGLHAQRRVSEETPVDTGRLRSSINYRVDQADKKVVVGTNVSYALAVHEPGIKRKYKGKPFIRNGIMNNLDEYGEIAKKVLKEGF